ncbi:MAG: hypothetical protein IT330_07235 [Anaerolineae bacterium]|nr:hypothetical protein [Anaerolineae bacterium]
MCIHKFLKAYGRRLELVVLAALALGIVAGIATLYLIRSSAASPTAGSVLPAPTAIPTPIPIKMTPLPASDIPNQPWFDDFFGEQVASADQALTRVGFKVLFPRVMAEGYQLVWVGVSSSAAPADAQMVNLVYSDGEHNIRISQAVVDVDRLPPRTDAQLAEWHQERVIINGHDGMGHGPLVGTTNIYGTTRSPSALKWWSDGVEHYVQSFELSLADLIVIAESMQ